MTTVAALFKFFLTSSNTANP